MRSDGAPDRDATGTRPAISPALDRAAGLTWRLLLLGVGLWVLAALFLRLRLVTVPAVVALLLATLLEPPARHLRRRGWPPLLATWAVVLFALAVLGAIAVFIVPRVAGELGQVGEEVEQAVRDIESWLTEGPIGLSEAELESYVDAAVERVRGSASQIGAQIVDGAYLAFEIAAGLVLALVMTFFFVKDGERIVDAVVGFVPATRQPLARRVGRRAWEALTAYVRGTAVVGVVDATVIGIGLAVIGVPLVLPLAVLTFFGAFFPFVGAVLAGLVAVLVALVSGGITDALLTLGVVLVVQQVEGDVLQPVVMGHALRLHPLVILVALTAGGVAAGLLGAFLAVPTAAVIAAVVSEVRNEDHLARST